MRRAGRRPAGTGRHGTAPYDTARQRTVPVTDTMPDGLLGLATALVGIPSVSHHEQVIADAVQAALELCPWLDVHRVGDNVVARTDLGRRRRVLLAGHLDTVPPAGGNDEPRLEGSTLHGLGAADMKGGLAVFLHLAGRLDTPAHDLTWCFYAAEEVAREHSGLNQLWAERPELLEADAAVLGEPTAGRVEAGCQGTLRVRIRLAGARAHTARPRPGATPSTASGRCSTPWPPTTSAARCSTAASTPSSSRPCPSKVGWPATSCRTRPSSC